MGTSNKGNITLRSEKFSPLDQAEMDANFGEVKNVIDDSITNENEIKKRVIYVDTIADLQALPVGELVDGQQVQVSGYYATNDGGGGPLRVWKTGAAGTYTDNGGSIIVPTGGDGSGAWVWEWSGAPNVRWFGAKGDGVSDDRAAIIATRDALGERAYLPAGEYYISDTIGLRSGSVIQGESPATSIILTPGNAVFSALDVDGVWIDSLGVEYTSAPTSPAELFSATSSVNLSITNIVSRIGRNMGFRGCSNVIVSNYMRHVLPAHAPEDTEPGGSILSAANNTANPICKNYMITNIEGYDLSEGIDFGTGIQDIALSNLHFESRAVTTDWDGSDQDSERFNEAIDAGGVKNFTCTNFDFKGFGNGFLLKHEIDTVENVAISNGVIEDYYISAVTIQAKGEANDGFVVSNITAESTRANTHVIYAKQTGGSGGSRNILVNNIIGHSESSCISLSACTNVSISDSFFDGQQAPIIKAVIYSVAGATSKNISITRCHLVARNGTNNTSTACIYADRIVNLTIKDSLIDPTNSNSLFYNLNTLPLTFHGNRVLPFESRGLNLSYSVDAYAPASGAPFRVSVVDNEFHGWGERAMYVAMNTLTQPAAPFVGITVCNNRFLADTISPLAGLQDALEFGGIPAGYIDGALITNNQIRSERGIRAGTLGVESVVANNVEINT